MFALQHIHKSYADKIILEDINFAVNSGEVIALIGENGAGKTTLLKILLGQVQPDSGTVSHGNEMVGYVPQEPILGNTVGASFTKDVEPWQIDLALETVGLSEQPRSKVVSQLSGGQKTRLALAQVLTLQRTILLLDEPTNNLDGEAIVWLEQFIKRFQGGVVLVSHDRTFINGVADKIVELRGGTLKQYGGNYDFYKAQKEIERQTELQRYETALEEKRHLEKAIASQQEHGQHAHKHIKRSDNDKYQRDFFRNRVTVKFGQQARALEKRLEQVDDVERPETVRDYTLSLAGEVQSSKLVLRLENISKSYGKRVLEAVSLEIRGNERLHIKGVNGSGKTTLLQIAASLVKPDEGAVIVGERIHIGYFSQDIDGLDYSLTGYENLQSTEASPTAIYREARSLGLNEADLRKRPNELSRGQQAKLGFARLLLGSNNLLILDEPTNHLDIPTRERIEAALKNYRGAILMASHDKYFADTLRISKTLNLTAGKLQ
jgi:ATPase subunit of ABC transporter with duplicated ATPase domains